MSHARKETWEPSDRGEFTRINPALIKMEAGSFWRDEAPHELEALKASIAWRERHMKGSGLLVPLLVTKMGDLPYYQLEDGFRRFKAIQALIAEGLPIDSVPVRILASPLTLSERLMLMTNGAKPLSALEEARVIVKLEHQGLSLESLARLMNQPLKLLKKRSVLGQLTGPIAEKLQKGTLSAETVEALLNSDEPVAAQQARLERELKHPAKKQVSDHLPEHSPKRGSETKTAWVPKNLDPTLHFLALEGLFEWMGGENGAKNGYSKKVVEIVKLMLKYSGGKMSLPEIAEKLKKF